MLRVTRSAARSRQQLHQHVVIDRVEEFDEVDVQRNAAAVVHARVHLPDRRLPMPSARGYASLTMSPKRCSHRGLAPHRFAPTLGAHPPFLPTCSGLRPARAACLKR